MPRERITKGKMKSYTPLLKGTFDYQNAIKDLLRKLREKLIPLDPKDNVFKKYIILIPKSQEKLREFYNKHYVSGEKLIIPNDNKAEVISKSMPQYFFVDYFPEIEKYSFS